MSIEQKAYWTKGVDHGIELEQTRIIKIIEAYGNPDYPEAWRPEIEQACNRLVFLIKKEVNENTNL